MADISEHDLDYFGDQEKGNSKKKNIWHICYLKHSYWWSEILNRMCHTGQFRYAYVDFYFRKRNSTSSSKSARKSNCTQQWWCILCWCDVDIIIRCICNPFLLQLYFSDVLIINLVINIWNSLRFFTVIQYIL